MTSPRAPLARERVLRAAIAFADVETLQPRVAPNEYPHLAEMMGWIMQTRTADAEPNDAAAGESEFEFGLELILDGLERLLRQ